MKEIEIDEEVFALVQAEAEPLVDDANSAIRRLLGLDGSRGRSSTAASEQHAARAPLGSLLPEEAYREPILLELLRRGGSGSAKEVTDAVGERIEDKLTKRDRETLTSGDIRWRARIQFTRLRMKEDGLIEAGSKRGLWVLTPKGRKIAEGLRSSGGEEP